MARNTPLGNVRSMLKAETGRSVSIGTQQDAELNQIIFDIQQWLASEYDWPFLRSRWDSNPPGGSRYVAFPTVDDVSLATAINFERPVSMYVKWNQVWQPVDYGIDETSEFNYLDSDRGQQLDPVQRWQFDDEANFEIWPLPSQTANLRFVGQRALTELRTSVGPPPVWNDAATLDLDDLMVSYFAAAEYLTRDEKKEQAKLILGVAQNRMTQIRAVYPKRTKECIIGRGADPDRRMLRVVPLVVVGPTN